jgi:hypothetical protein
MNSTTVTRRVLMPARKLASALLPTAYTRRPKVVALSSRRPGR